jgi:hypothetical protein
MSAGGVVSFFEMDVAILYVKFIREQRFQIIQPRNTEYGVKIDSHDL